MNPLLSVRLQAVLIALLLVAGGVRVGTYEAPSPTRTPAAIWEAALALRTARVEVVSDLSVKGVHGLRASGAGDLDLAAGRSLVRIEYDEAGRKLGFVTADELADGPTLYLRKPGRRWYSTRLPIAAGGARPYDPVAVISRVPRLTRVGDERVRGVRATHYAGAATGLIRTIDVWVGASGLPVRVVADFLAPADTVATMTVDLYGYGEPAPISELPQGVTELPIDRVYQEVAAS